MKRGEASSAMPAEVESVIRSQVSEVLASGSKVVGVIGFSQGTRVVAGLLKGAEIRNAVVERCGEAKAAGESEWLGGLRFGVSVCGSYPPPLIPESAKKLLELLPEGDREDVEKRKIEIPTLHIQGKQDEWEWAGELLIEGAYEVGEGKSEVVRFDMGHHYPVSVEENERIRDWVLEQWHGVAYQQGL
jgi:predicted esterase